MDLDPDTDMADTCSFDGDGSAPPPTHNNVPAQVTMSSRAATPQAATPGSTSWITGDSSSIEDTDHPFFVHSNNAPTFKYKYPQAAPTPPGEDDVVWNKVYTAADSRMYNKHHKSANESRKFRESGETRILAYKMLAENKVKHANGVPPRGSGGSAYASGPRPPKPKHAGVPKQLSSNFASSFYGDLSASDVLGMSISEKIKSEGRSRKAPSVTPSSNHGTPGPSSAPQAGSPTPSIKNEKLAVKKKGTAALLKKRAPKRTPHAKAKAPASVHNVPKPLGPRLVVTSDSESNDGGEYCICRGPDDHRMMVYCEGGCEDWYHCSCIGFSEEAAKELLDRFICPKCNIDDVQVTTWKRMCRNYGVNGCQRAARVNNGSKYCSDECIAKFWDYVYSLVRADSAPSLGGALNRQEVATLLGSVKNVEEFHALGKKPKLPVPEGIDPTQSVGTKYLTPEEKELLEDIEAKKDKIQLRLVTVRDQFRLLQSVLKRKDLAAKHPNVDVKKICGYDNRLTFNEEEFRRWRQSEEGKKALDPEGPGLGPRTAETMSIGAHVPYPGQEIPAPLRVPEALDNICLEPATGSKKCKHQHWAEILKSDLGLRSTILGEELRKLEKEANDIIDDAETREATKDYHADNVTIELF